MPIFNIITEFYNKFGHIFSILFQIIIVIVPLLLGMAYLVLAERKIIGAMQRRQGPAIVGPFGLLQPFADALKLILKEVIIPNKADWKLFIFGPILTFTLSLICWAIIPFGTNANGTPNVIANINIGLLYWIAISSLSVYGVIIAGWASNSKYAFLGAIRSAAQMISYEISIGFSLMLIIMITGSLNLSIIVNKMHEAPIWMKLLNLPMCVIFFISILAETNRHPFDLPEAEAELVAGYNVEYSSMTFALFYLGEYLNMILSSAMITLLFLGGWFPPLEISFLYMIPGLIWMILKMCFVLFLFIWIRVALPRYRYDQLMRIGWKFFMPLSLIWLVFGASILFFTKF